MEPVPAPTAKGANTRCGSSGSMPGFLPSSLNALPRVHRILPAAGKGDYRDKYESKRHATGRGPATGHSTVFARQRLSRCYKFCTHGLQFLSSGEEFLMLPSGRLPCFEEGAGKRMGGGKRIGRGVAVRQLTRRGGADHALIDAWVGKARFNGVERRNQSCPRSSETISAASRTATAQTVMIRRFSLASAMPCGVEISQPSRSRHMMEPQRARKAFANRLAVR